MHECSVVCASEISAAAREVSIHNHSRGRGGEVSREVRDYLPDKSEAMHNYSILEIPKGKGSGN